MGSENLVYALTQVVHNFGAAAVLGGAVFVLWPVSHLEEARKFAWLILGAWGAQIVSGVVFGITSFYYYGETPDLSSIALTALAIKVGAAIVGFSLAAFFLARGKAWSGVDVKRSFQGLAALGAIALTAAAFLRWFS